MVPEGWERKALSEIVKEKISYGIVQAGPHVTDGVPYIKSSDVRSNINPSSLRRTSHEIHQKYRRSSVHPGDIVFSLRGHIGESAIVPDQLKEANLTQGTARISVASGHDNKFYFYQLRSGPLLNRINALSKGSTFKEISLEELRKVKVLSPPHPEQQKIAKILSTWDEAIATTEQLLANSEQQKRALMQQLLTGKKRLPAFGSEKWKKIKVGEMFDPSKEKAGDSPLEVYSVTKSGLVSQEEYFKKSVSSEDKTSYKVVRKGYFVMSGLNFWMGSVDVHVEKKNVIVSPAYKVYRVSGGFEVGFVRHFVRSQGFMKVLIGSSLTGASIVRRNFSGTIFNNWPLEMPGKEEQEEIAKVIDCAEREVDLLAADLDRLKEEKKALMQQLLTGKRRVKVNEAEQATV